MEVLLVLVAALLLGGVLGWIVRRPIFGGALTGTALAGLALTWAAGKLWLHDANGDLDSFFDLLIGVLLYIGALIAFTIIGVVGLGTMVGAALRGAASS